MGVTFCAAVMRKALCSQAEGLASPGKAGPWGLGRVECVLKC